MALRPSRPSRNVLDPRRLGKQNSGFSDDDIADIICLLLPYSDGSRAELREMALRTSQHMVDADEAAHPDLQAVAGQSIMPHLVGEHALVLRLSAHVKDPLQGFTFGRNVTRCDVCFHNDPMRRLSNIHFRIYLNEYGVLMLEDSSINGTVVDGTLLKARQGDRTKTGEKKLPKRRTINPGSKIQILMHEGQDDLDFIVQIPRREGDYEETYRRNLTRYMKRLQQIRAENEPVDAAKTITAGPGGHVDLFPVNETKQPTPRAKRQLRLPDDPTQEDMGRLPREWNGSNRYNRVGRIGKGAFATVYKVTAKFDGKPYAAKELDKRKFMKNGVLDQKVENEMRIMQRVKHANIVEYIEHIDWDDRLMIIIMEYVPNGDLGSLIGDNGPLREDIVREMSSQMLSALSYLHANNITHRDVKPDNILCHSYSPFVVKLTDFGLSKMVETEQTFLKTFCGTLLYCAPEVYNEFAEYDEYGHRHPRNRQRRRPQGQRYDHAIDIWSLGGVLYYTLTGDPPFPAKNGISYTELLHQIMTKKVNTQPLEKMSISEDGIDFLLRIIQRRPEQRATIEELRSHPWLQGTEFSQQSNEDDVDEGLQKEASQLSLQDRDFPVQIPATVDGIDDDDDLNLEQYDGEGVDDVQFDGYESQKENYTFGQMDQQRSKLFGEVNGSAVGSAGVIPSTRLNLPDSMVSLDRTEILDPEIKDSYGSEDSTPRQTKRSQPTPRATVPAALTQSRRSASRSLDEINNMTFDAESQDLEGAESQLEHLNMKSLLPSHGLSYMSSFNTSKRKPGYDMSDEFDNTPRARPPIKKLRSDSLFGDAMSWDEDSEQGLYAQIPPLSRVNSSRQIDKPVHKSTYWDARDKGSWHLRYPEMTQLQHDAFASAAKARGESFAPGKSALWDLAMKHFPPADGQTPPPPEDGSSASDAESRASRRRSDASSDRPWGSDNAGNEDEDMPDTLPPDHGTVIPAQADPPLNRVVATLESAEGSVVSGISVPINQAMISWGRAPENTHIYTPKTESKVPKYALKVILWKEGYEPSKNFRPWNSAADGFHFFMSTKATNGIQINKTVLPSDEPKNPKGPSKNWIELHDGDLVTFWRSGDGDEQLKAKLVFRCSWGGSSQPRATPAELVQPDLAEHLDASCRKAEERIKKLAEYDHSLEEADLDALERHKNIERERLRSQNFETKRLEACRMLAMRASRRSSPASASPIVPPSSAPPAIMTGVGAISRHRSVPALKHATSGLDTRALQTMAEE
ncbi:Protein kinase protein rad53 [Diaporthe eres]|uniref:Autophagy-related protein 1 n=1 Tax=Diaporthe eres TaxID=83184 RepID=A0ABR1PNY2_DIAER